jgi:hypothetical protein
MNVARINLIVPENINASPSKTERRLRNAELRELRAQDRNARTQERHVAFMEQRRQEAGRQRWANNTVTAFTIAGTVLMAWGIVLGVRPETRSDV